MDVIPNLLCPWCNEKLNSLNQLGQRLKTPRFLSLQLVSAKAVLVCPYCNEKVRVKSSGNLWLLPFIFSLAAISWLFYIGMTVEPPVNETKLIFIPFGIGVVFGILAAILRRIGLRLEKSDST